MKRILILAIVLLNLLSLTKVSAQNYISETGSTCTGMGIYCSAMNSDADIYTEVYNESSYEFEDYSEYGDYSQEVVTSDGEHYYYNYGDMGNSVIYYYEGTGSSASYSDTSNNSNGGYSGGYGVTSGYGDDDVTWQTGLDEIVVTGTSTSKDYYCILCEERMTAEEWATHNCPNAVTHAESAESGNVQGGGGTTVSQGNASSDDSLRSGEPMGEYWLDPSRHCSVNELKSMIKYCPNSNIISNLPEKFKMQGTNADCTARALATAAWIHSGDAVEYDYVMQMSYIVADEYGVYISDDGVNSTDYMQIYSKYFDIEEIKPEIFTSNVIKTCIDSGKCVIGTFCTGDVDYIFNPPVKHAHDVTIVAYTDDSYYCAYGEEDVLKVPRDAIDCHTVHVLNGIKDSFVITNK